MDGGAVVPGAKLYTYLSGGNTPQSVYTNSALTVAHANPVVADADGTFPVIYLSPVAYRFLITDANGSTVFPAVDNIYDFAEVQLAASGGSALVGYIQSGTGAVAQTVQARLRQKVSVVDFGATGDGVTSDLAAFENAVTRAGQGGTVVIPDPPGGQFYNLGAGLVIQNVNNLTIEGESSKAVIAATGTNADAITLYGCDNFQLRGFTIQGVSGGRHGVVVGKSDGTAASFYGIIDTLTIPPNLDGDGIKVYHGMLLRIMNVQGYAVPSNDRPCTSATLNGGVYGPGVATTTSSGINLVLQASGQNNAINVTGCIIDGWRGFALQAEGVDELLIQGATLEGCARNYTLLTNPANVKLIDCSRTKILNVYMEILAAGTAGNIYADGCKDLQIDGVIYGADTSTAGYITIVDNNRPTLTNCFGEGISIDATTTDASLDAVSYGGNGGTFSDASLRSRRSRMVNISATNAAAGGQTLVQQMNLLQNPGLEQWSTTAAPYDFTVSNCTALRTGTGEADTVKFRGRYACKLSTRTNALNGLVYTLVDYGVSTTRAAMVGSKVTVSAWVNVTAGTSGIGISAVYDGSTTDDSASLAANGSGWVKISHTFIVRTGFSVLDVRLILKSDTTVAYVDEVAVFYGDSQTMAVADRSTELGPYGSHVLTSTTTPTYDHQVAPAQSMILTGNVTAVTLANPIRGKHLTLLMIQDGTGGRTVTGYSPAVKWRANTEPVFSAAINAQSSVTLQYIGSTWYQIGDLTEYQ